MVAILIQNGGGDAQGSERGLEYDTLSGKFAQFIEREVLPHAQKRYGVTLSHDPDARAAMGCSSGAAAAFTMAWFHPEWYHRVISYSRDVREPAVAVQPGRLRRRVGVSREADSRFTCAKPIRIWMQVGDRDLYNPNIYAGRHAMIGSVANHRMAAALKSQTLRLSVHVRAGRRALRSQGTRTDSPRGARVGFGATIAPNRCRT